MKHALYIAFFIPTIALAQDDVKILRYKFNENVHIYISNAPCQHQKLIKQYPYAAAAVRVDGASLSGCFKNEADNIKVQWNGGDFTVIPANSFLTGD